MYQKTIIVGNLGSSPELRFTPQGDPVTSFGVAVNRRWTNREGQPNEETTWFQVSVWGSQAEACCQYLTKGRLVLVEGRLIPDQDSGGPRLWTGNDGQVRANYELRAIAVQFLGGGEGSHPSENANTSGPTDLIPQPGE